MGWYGYSGLLIVGTLQRISKGERCTMTQREIDIVDTLRTMQVGITPVWTSTLNAAADEIVSLRNKVKALEEYIDLVKNFP